MIMLFQQSQQPELYRLMGELLLDRDGPAVKVLTVAFNNNRNNIERFET